MRTFLSAIALVALLCTPPAVAQEADPAKGAKVLKNAGPVTWSATRPAIWSDRP